MEYTQLKPPQLTASEYAATQRNADRLQRLVHAFSRIREKGLNVERVILAAPAMLEALDAVIAGTGGSEHWNGETHEFLVLCEAAIRAVKGA